MKTTAEFPDAPTNAELIGWHGYYDGDGKVVWRPAMKKVVTYESAEAAKPAVKEQPQSSVGAVIFLILIFTPLLVLLIMDPIIKRRHRKNLTNKKP